MLCEATKNGHRYFGPQKHLKWILLPVVSSLSSQTFLPSASCTLHTDETWTPARLSSQSRHGICLFLFKILFYIWVLLNKLPQNWLDLLTHLTLHDCESLLSFWNQDCWACRHSALVITPSLSRLRPRNTHRAVSLSLAVNSRTSEFWGK